MAGLGRPVAELDRPVAVLGKPVGWGVVGMPEAAEHKPSDSDCLHDSCVDRSLAGFFGKQGQQGWRRGCRREQDRKPMLC